MDKPEAFISSASWSYFLEYTASQFDCSYLGLLIAKHRPPLGFGVLAQLIKACPDVGTALAKGHQHVGIFTDLRWDLRIYNELATVARVDRLQLEGEMRQHKSLSIAQYFKLLKGLLGPQWCPGSIYFMFSPPKNIRHYKQFFGAPVYFGQEYDGINFSASDLQIPISTHDADLLLIIEQHIATMERGKDDSLTSKVDLVIRQQLDSGVCSIELAASKMGMHSKALQRALKAENTTFKELLSEARMQVAELYLSNTDIELIQLSDILGYSCPSALSRSFKKHHGVSPQQWRQTR
jgi:AraC-like DNA-binding protein